MFNPQRNSTESNDVLLGEEDFGDDPYGGDDGDEGMDNGWGDVNFEGADHELISAPRRVAQIGLNYARTSKQVKTYMLHSM